MSVKASDSVKTTDCPVLPVVPVGNAVSVGVMVPCTYEMQNKEPSEGERLNVVEACPFASVVVVALVTPPNADNELANVQLTVALGTGLPVASLTSTTTGLKVVIGLVGQA